MIAEMFQAVSEIPEWEGIKIGISCFCGGSLETISGEFTIESGTSIGRDEVVRCQRCGSEFDADDQERLMAQSQGYSATPVHPTKLCA